MRFLEVAAKITLALSEYVECVAEQSLSFQGDDPFCHSRANHVHLWKIEWLADDYPQIDLSIRRQAIEYIFERWRVRLKSFRPHREHGYRMFVYEDAAPTVSVVAETQYGFPYGGEPQFATDMTEVLLPYTKRSWKARFSADAFFKPKDEIDILDAIERARGSLGTRAAQLLGTNVAELRKRIAWLEIGTQVNGIRKRFHRRPAKFVQYEELSHRYKVFEIRLPSQL
jgi:hypothetical protein